VADIEFRNITSEGLLRASSFKGLSKGTGQSRWRFRCMTTKCRICFGLGWVCENHPNRVWSEELGCQCGAGMPCECVRTDGLEEPDVSGVLSENPSQQQ
jgi:hypothetical protein